MSSNHFELVLGKSTLLSFLLMGVYGGAGLIVVWLSISLPISIPVFLLLNIVGITLLFFHYKKVLDLHAKRRSKNAIVRIWQDTRGFWGCQTRNGHSFKATLKGSSFKSQWMFILHFRVRHRFLPVIILRDAMNTTEFRLLCTRFNLSKENTIKFRKNK